MFSSHIDHLSKSRKLHILNEKFKFNALIDLSRGASLDELVVKGNTIINRIEDERAKQIYYSAFLFPFVNRLDGGKFRFRESEYKFPINEPENNNAIHGFIADKVFTLRSVDCSEAQAVASFDYKYAGELTYFPFPFKISVVYTFFEDGLAIELRAENTGTTNFPFSLGWHPYFHISRKADNLISFKANKIVTVDDRCIPNEVVVYKNDNSLDVFRDRIDDCYKLTVPECVLRTQDYTMRLSSSQESNYLQIYHPPKTSMVAVEPLTGITNCFNNKIGLRVLEPNHSFSQVWNVEVN